MLAASPAGKGRFGSGVQEPHVSYTPFFAEVQAHYDLSDKFFALFLDPSMTYSCAYFERSDMTLAEAQQAKIDLSLGKLNLKPDMTLLDIGCGWGALIRRASEQHGAKVIGLTLSRNQFEHVQPTMRELPTHCEVRLAGWEQFDEPVDRIVSIGAFEHFRIERYAAFFERCREMLADGGRMLLHTIVAPDNAALRARGIEITHENVLFAKFIGRHIFPGGQLAAPPVIERHATQAGFKVERVQSLQMHYARTLDEWSRTLEARRADAIAITAQEVYDMYQHYLTGCAKHFRSGHVDVMQFTLAR
jgi:cyclopropane-fatty-acyl-phospholipid synthase